MDNAICFYNTYPLDSDLFGGSVAPSNVWTTEAWSLSEVITFILWSRSLLIERWNHTTFKVSALFFKVQFPSKKQNLKIILFWRNLLTRLVLWKYSYPDSDKHLFMFTFIYVYLFREANSDIEVKTKR